MRRSTGAFLVLLIVNLACGTPSSEPDGGTVGPEDAGGCTPECAEKQCGTDGCGGQCAPGCGVDEYCDGSGRCTSGISCGASGLVCCKGTTCNTGLWCAEGTCRQCASACVAGQLRCFGDAAQTCQVTPSGCLDWGTTERCSTREACEEGRCVVTCSDECAAGATRCSGDRIETCRFASSGCAKWDAPEECTESHALCLNDRCVVSPSWVRLELDSQTALDDFHSSAWFKASQDWAQVGIGPPPGFSAVVILVNDVSNGVPDPLTCSNRPESRLYLEVSTFSLDSLPPTWRGLVFSRNNCDADSLDFASTYELTLTAVSPNRVVGSFEMVIEGGGPREGQTLRAVGAFDAVPVPL